MADRPGAKLPDVYPDIGQSTIRDGRLPTTSAISMSAAGLRQETFAGVDPHPGRPYHERHPGTTTLSTQDWSALMERHGYIYTDRSGNWQKEYDSDENEDLQAYTKRMAEREPPMRYDDAWKYV